MKIIAKPLENYLTEKQKIYVFFLLISFFFGVMNALSSNAFLYGVLALLGLAITTAIFLAKKGFISASDAFYQGLMIGSLVFHKEKIDTQDYESVLIFENTKQQSVPPWTGLTIDMFINDNAFILYLISEHENKKEYLMSFREKEPMDDAVQFLQNNTNLKIEFADT